MSNGPEFNKNFLGRIFQKSWLQELDSNKTKKTNKKSTQKQQRAMCNETEILNHEIKNNKNKNHKSIEWSIPISSWNSPTGPTPENFINNLKPSLPRPTPPVKIIATIKKIKIPKKKTDIGPTTNTQRCLMSFRFRSFTVFSSFFSLF